MKTVMVSCFAVACAITTFGLSSTFAQAVPASTTAQPEPLVTDAEISLMRRDLRAEKKKLIALNVPFTPEESTRFWPVYDAYALEMAKLNDSFYSTIRDFSENGKTWTDAQAAAMLDKWVKIQADQAKTRQKYIPLVEKVIPAKKAALFFQIDRRLYTLMDLQTSTYLPLATQ
jgi:hypothetical protein